MIEHVLVGQEPSVTAVRWLPLVIGAKGNLRLEIDHPTGPVWVLRIDRDGRLVRRRSLPTDCGLSMNMDGAIVVGDSIV